MNKEIGCPFCNVKAFCQTSFHDESSFYACPVCGRYEIVCDKGIFPLEYNKTATYLFYHCFPHNKIGEYRYHTNKSKEWCDKYSEKFQEGDNEYGHPVHMDQNIVDSWYPKNFTERINNILLYISSHTQHIGEELILDNNQMYSLLFIDRYEIDTQPLSKTYGKPILREKRPCYNEALYMLESLEQAELLRFNFGTEKEQKIFLRLTPKGYSRVDELQKNTAYGRNALVAMKFGDDTKALREAIRKGVSDAGYIAIFIDEVQHNDFITPELLKHIRDSKFVVCDLTHQNNGAYFEEGYAMGLGKPVIQLCKKDTKLHFDIAQKNTIIWSGEEEISEMLKNRIKSTID